MTVLELWDESKKTVATVRILYFRPDYNSILNEFVWQVDDYVPQFPRIKRFAQYWQTNLITPIHEIYIMHGNKQIIKHTNWILET